MAKQSQQWKQHERDVAKYFGTSRRLRGSDFSQSDVEVLVNFNDWASRPIEENGPLLIVECKYSKNMALMDEWKKFDSSSDGITIVKMGSYYLMPLEGVKEFFQTFVLKTHHRESLEILEYFDIVSTSKKVPGYLDGYMEQSRGYIEEITTGNITLPLVCMAKARTQGKLVAINRGDLEKFIDRLNPNILYP
jgi:hypothetical protein